jgi:hypothetical protein
MLVVLDTTVPSSVLKKKHNAIAYHRVREAIAARIMRFAYMKSEENVSDVLKKPLKFFTSFSDNQRLAQWMKYMH